MTKAKIRDKYQALSRQELPDKAYELASSYDSNSNSCSQSTVAAIHELLDIDDTVVKVATSLCGGSAMQTLGTCGALAGGIIVLDYYFGRPIEKTSYQKRIQANMDALYSAFEAPELLADRFVKEYGTFICGQLQRQLFGRIYCLSDRQELEKLGKAEAQSGPQRCGHIVGNTARWVVDILLDKGTIEP